jgi:hypothetical protein
MNNLIALLLKALGRVGELIAGLLTASALTEIKRLTPKVELLMGDLRERTDLTGKQKADIVVQKTKAYFGELGVRIRTTDVLNVIQLIYNRWLVDGVVK